MKKSKIFFILTAVFVIITIGTFFYMNSREQICVDFLNEHPELTSESEREWKKISESEYKQVRSQYLRYDKANSNAEMIFKISVGITVVLLATGIVLVIVEKKKKQRNI